MNWRRNLLALVGVKRNIFHTSCCLVFQEGVECKAFAHSDLIMDFSTLLQQKSLSDITLICGDRKLDVHKAVLAARSPIFRVSLYFKLFVYSVSAHLHVSALMPFQPMLFRLNQFNSTKFRPNLLSNVLKDEWLLLIKVNYSNEFKKATFAFILPHSKSCES